LEELRTQTREEDHTGNS